MKQIRLMIIGSLVTLVIGAVFFIIGICLPSSGLKNGMFAIAVVFGLTFVIALYASYKYYKDNKDKIENDKKQNALRDQFLKNWEKASAEIGKIYDETDIMSVAGVAKFAKDGLEFEIEGKYAIIKDFKGKAGNHFAFEITSKRMIKKPDDYDDVCDYESIGFRISVGYFDEVALSDYENENGVIIPNTSDLEGKIFELSSNAGYDFQIITVEMDLIEKGQIHFLKWNDNEKIVAFKFAVPAGLHDVVAGAVLLKEDK